jgi:uncharacterized repeat protein (TIGR03803 family)
VVLTDFIRKQTEKSKPMKTRSKELFLLAALVALLGLMLPGPVRAQSTTFNALYDFTEISGPHSTNSDGGDSQAGLVLSGNAMYGTAYYGGNAGNGTVFGIIMDGSALIFTNLHSFTATNGPNSTNYDGANPIGGLILSGDTLYGTAQNGGAGGSGCVFRINTDGSHFTNLYSFYSNAGSPYYTNTDGANPVAGLVLSANTLYGVAQNGGGGGDGTVFGINTVTLGFTNLHSFGANSGSPQYTNSEGAYPSSSLVLSGNTLYGTAQGGGRFGNGTVFEVNTVTLGFTNLHDFTFASSASPNTNGDGANPIAGLVLSGDTLYGVAQYGGSGGNGTVFSVNTVNLGFTNLYSFTATNGPNSTNYDGANPIANLILLSDTLYGTAYQGGTGGSGTLFSLRTGGSNFMNLYNFTATAGSDSTNGDGAYPLGDLILSDNTLYSTTAGGGNAGNGTVFALGLPAPVLGIALVSNQVVISWPAWGSNFLLQIATNFSSGTWSNITSGLATAGTNYVFTNALNGHAAYFRLQQQ